MTKTFKAWRWMAVMSGALLALALATTAFAQGPPKVPHQFWGLATTELSVDGTAVEVGATIEVINADTGDVIDSTTLAADGWIVRISPDDASSVQFRVGGATSDAFQVVEGASSETPLALTAGGGAPAPGGLPSTGTGGLGDSGSSLPVLPLALAATVIVALGGATLTRRSTLR